MLKFEHLTICHSICHSIKAQQPHPKGRIQGRGGGKMIQNMVK